MTNANSQFVQSRRAMPELDAVEPGTSKMCVCVCVSQTKQKKKKKSKEENNKKE